MKVLAAFAHPDDIEMLCAGTLRLLVEQGWELRCVTLTGGDLGATSGTRDQICTTRLAEAQRAAALLGGAYACAGLEDLAIHYCPEQLAAVIDQIRRFAPDVVLTHSPDCYMLDHEETARLVRAACFGAPIPLYQTVSAPTQNGVPALYYADAMDGVDKFGNEVKAAFHVDITSTFQRRQDALACHASQRDWLRAHHGIDEYLLANERLARLHGAKCGVQCAEGFRQHLGHGYPHQNRLAQALAGWIHFPKLPVITTIPSASA